MKKGKATTNGGSGGTLVIEARNRKALRKEQRNLKKKRPQQHQHHSSPNTEAQPQKKKHKTPSSTETKSTKTVKFSSVVDEKIIPIKNEPAIKTSLLKKSRKDSNEEAKTSKRRSFNTSTTQYSNLDDETAAALRRDDMEIEYLESSLGIRKSGGKKGNRELNREYAKNEGFGDDFGDFLMGLDSLVERVVAGDEEGGSVGSDVDDSEEEQSDCEGEKGALMSDDEPGELVQMSDEERYESDDQEEQGEIQDFHNQYFYDTLDEDTAIAFRNDDAEIAALESKLGLTSGDKKAKKKLNKEFAKSFSGYGEDFGDFLDDLDSLAYRVGMGKDVSLGGGGRNGSEDEQSDAQVDIEENDDGSEQGNDESDSESSQDSDASEIEVKKDKDHDVAFTYQPSSGEDIYGNQIDSNINDAFKPTKYIPPHLRKKMEQGSTDTTAKDASATMKSVVETADPETLRMIQRSLNNSLNRLSENTLESVSKSLAALYSQYPFHDLNTCLWKNIKSACIPPAMVMSGLIPLYTAAVSGVHWIGGDRIQLGGCLIEWSTKQLHDLLEKGRSSVGDTQNEEGFEVVNKEASNTLLIVCYLYNYGVVHCALIYDLIKDLIKNFSEIDVESLLLILSHCGQQLRSDDPSALREIILMVKERAQKDSDGATGANNHNKADSSRVEFMLSTITELKNNKPRKQDIAIRDKTGTFKKCIGRLKSSANNSLLVKGTGTCLRITLQDILDAEMKGRWWIMGASWAGNQKFIGGDNLDQEDEKYADPHVNQRDQKTKKGSEEDKLLALASSQRMNTETRRSIFCIVMTSTDYNDAFVKLSRAELLKPKNERDVIRVLVHCCGEEKSYNPFYEHLIMRVCEHQHKSKFTLMLSFWDIFKQLDSFSVRKTANLALLLAKLLSGTKEKYLTIGALKRIDFSPTEMSEQVVLFLSLVMSTLFESSDSAMIRDLFNHDCENKKPTKKNERRRPIDVFDSDDEDKFIKQTTSKREDLSELKESIATFLLQYVKSSPKNVEGSKWNVNFTAAIEACESDN